MEPLYHDLLRFQLAFVRHPRVLCPLTACLPKDFPSLCDLSAFAKRARTTPIVSEVESWLGLSFLTNYGLASHLLIYDSTQSMSGHNTH